MTDRGFNTQEPIAYLLTWTTYGTWLPGDERGWWRRSEGIRHAPDILTHDMASSDLRETPFLLSGADRTIVRGTLQRHCQIRSWLCHASSVRSNHVHIVVTASGCAPETVRDQLKAWCTRKLKTHHPNRKRYWTEGASCRWINHESDLEAAVEYVMEAQDRKSRDLQ